MTRDDAMRGMLLAVKRAARILKEAAEAVESGIGSEPAVEQPEPLEGTDWDRATDEAMSLLGFYPVDADKIVWTDGDDPEEAEWK